MISSYSSSSSFTDAYEYLLKILEWLSELVIYTDENGGPVVKNKLFVFGFISPSPEAPEAAFVRSFSASFDDCFSKWSDVPSVYFST